MKKLLFFLLLVFPFGAKAYVSPGATQGFVSDFAQVLSVEEKASLGSLISDFEKKTGNEIAVIFVKNIQGETIETYAVKLFEDWEIGKSGKDNGVLFLASIEDREVRIEVGYGLEGDLTDIESKDIIDNFTIPYFKEGDYFGGTMASVLNIISSLDPSYQIPPSLEEYSEFRASSGGSGFDVGFLIWIFVFGFIWLGSVLSRSRSWWLGGVIGSLVGAGIWILKGTWIFLPVIGFFGFIFDYLVSTKYKKLFEKGSAFKPSPWIFLMGGRPGSKWDKGGGFGGFGGGMSGGGGASGRW